jgi:DHA1 family bicyclomycin/chloramphenicol resistance-like MFS transporter
VPIVAPTVGAAGIAVASWRWLFVGCAIAAGGMAIWLTRMVETLAHEHRLELRVGRLVSAARIVVSERSTVGYTLALTAMYGGFTSYIGSSEIIFGEVYDVVDRFPLFFGGMAAVMGLMMVLNSRIVVRVGSRRLSHAVMAVYIAASALLLLGGLLDALPLWAFVALMSTTLAAHALAIPNFNALAMQPMGAVAGTASSLIGTVQVAVGALLGAVLDQAFDGTTVPIAAGFLGYGVLAYLAARWADAHGRAQRRTARTALVTAGRQGTG